ncbi:AAA family ATPase [Sedimentisphaera salicampi]|uniref:AAA family ATPase n=1 Tax=Sedimentisphaera salicampi TaxID=1941349 RepID=UPI000B9C569A|nr:AAA family ATPase [Sedimentisphaera salicampi]OXU13966.1 hypothetical protein SMSP1_02127 [Sedimentisphaera salicampi]
MSNEVKILTFASLEKLVERLQDDFGSGDMNFLLIFAFNGVGKTRLSMAFKDECKRKNNGSPETLYFNAFTEDLFTWYNDLEGDSDRSLKINAESKFFAGLEELEMETRIRPLLDRYVNFDFRIDVEKWEVIFSREVLDSEGSRTEDGIKISRGEENIFIWCFFLAVVELAMDEDIAAYSWVKYIYIDDPISSLDENNAIAVAHDLAKKLVNAKSSVKVIVSSHHALFFNVICNELRDQRRKKYFLYRPDSSESYTLRVTNNTPFFHHVAMLSEIQRAANTGNLYTYHFNMLRSVMEKTAIFFGRQNFGSCLAGAKDEALFARSLNLFSHGQYSIYEPIEMLEDNKKLFREMLKEFLEKHDFELPIIQAAEAKDNR